MAGESTNTLDNDLDNVFGSTLGDEGTVQQELQTEHQTSQDEGAEDQTQQQVGGNAPDQQDEQQSKGHFDEFGPAPKGPPQRDAQGRILGRDGKPLTTRDEKRDFYTYNRLRSAAEKIGKRNDQLEKENQQLQHIAALPRQLGLDAETVTDGLQLVAQFNRDPIAGTREVVARALALGHSMEELFGTEGVGVINGRMVSGEIERHMRPLNERFASEQREQEINQRAQSDLDAFVSEHEFADVHGNQIAYLVENNEGMSPQKAYYELRMWAVQNGFDFSQPLQPQVESRTQRNRETPSQRQQQQPQRQGTLPGNRRVAGGNAPVNGNTYAAPDSSFADIVRKAMFDSANQ